jgi:hypothetical protein
MRRRRTGGDVGERERLQLPRIVASLHELVGIDIIYRRIYIQVSNIIRREHTTVTPAVMCAYGFNMGRQDHMAGIAQMFYEWYDTRKNSSGTLCLRITTFMLVLISHIRSRLQRETERKTALAMALHLRLGARAEIAELGVDLLAECVPVAMPSIHTWREAMGKWIGDDTMDVSS